MVQVYRKVHEYPDPPSTTLLAFFLRYPNPFARHVLSVDVLSRYVDPNTGKIHTQRLILKRGILPKWINSWMPAASASGGRGLDAWVLEESIIDPPGWNGEGSQPRAWTEQGNLNHKKVMHVIEGGRLEASPTGTTLHYTTAEVRSELGGRWSSLLRQKIESYGMGKFDSNAETARKGMSLIISLLRNRQPLPDTAEFYPPPPPGFGDSWPDGNRSDRTDRTSGLRGDRGEKGPASFFLSPGTLANMRSRRKDYENVRRDLSLDLETSLNPAESWPVGTKQKEEEEE